MVKKIILGVVFTALAGGLIYGGVYRTAARLESDRQPQSQSLRQNKAEEERQNSGNENGSRGQGGNRQNDNNGKNSQQDRQESQESQESMAFSAEVVEITDDSLVLLAQNGSEVVIEGRAWQFAIDEGFTASINDSVEITGFYDDAGQFEVSWISSITNGSYASIRNESGRPNWAGGSGGGGNGGGKGRT